MARHVDMLFLLPGFQHEMAEKMISPDCLPQVALRAFFGRPGQWFEENDLDGDKNSIFHDVDGSVTGYTDTYVGRADNLLIQHPACVSMPQWSGVVCSGRYSQVRPRRCLVASGDLPSSTEPLLPPSGIRADAGSPQPHFIHLSG